MPTIHAKIGDVVVQRLEIRNPFNANTATSA
jgi:hypothetical protein